MLASFSVIKWRPAIPGILAMLLLSPYLVAALGLPVGFRKVVFVVAVVGFVCGLFVEGVSERGWLGVLFVVLLIVIALGTPSPSWDARSIWLFHAKRIFYDGSLYAQFDGYAPWSHNDYPSLVPLLMASAASVVGHWNEVFPKAVIPLVMAPLLISLLHRLREPPAQIAFLALLAGLAMEHLVDGYMDALLAVAFVATCADFIDSVAGRGQSFASMMRMFSFAATLTLVKNEGLALLVCIVAGVSAVTLVKQRRLGAASLAIIALSFIPVLAWKLTAGNADVVGDLAGANPGARLLERMHDMHAVLLVGSAMASNLWLLVTAGPLLALALTFRRQFLAWPVLVVLGLYVGLLALVYLSTPNDLAWHLNTSIDRTLLPVSMASAFFSIKFLFEDDGGIFPVGLRGIAP